MMLHMIIRAIKLSCSIRRPWVSEHHQPHQLSISEVSTIFCLFWILPTPVNFPNFLFLNSLRIFINEKIMIFLWYFFSEFLAHHIYYIDWVTLWLSPNNKLIPTEYLNLQIFKVEKCCIRKRDSKRIKWIASMPKSSNLIWLYVNVGKWNENSHRWPMTYLWLPWFTIIDGAKSININNNTRAELFRNFALINCFTFLIYAKEIYSEFVNNHSKHSGTSSLHPIANIEGSSSWFWLNLYTFFPPVLLVKVSTVE